MTKSISNRASVIFAVIAVVGSLVLLLDWQRPAALQVRTGDSGTIQNLRNEPIEPGAQVRVRGSIHTNDAGALLDAGSTQIILDQRTYMEVRAFEAEQINLFFTRGHWSVVPDRPTQSCTRAVCVESNSPYEVYYYTPGEVVEVRSQGEASVRFNDTVYTVPAGGKLTIDELTGSLR